MKTVKINDLLLPLDTDFSAMKPVAAREMGCKTDCIESVTLYRKSVDARKKDNVRFCVSLTVKAKLKDGFKLKSKKCSFYKEKEYAWQTGSNVRGARPVIVGFGPCGMFAALTLARAGAMPIVLERGADVDTRSRDVAAFWRGGKLKENSNVQFGEGGAGTFSDGKLNTGIKDIRTRAVLKEFYRHGADESVLYDAKPHVGTDRLVKIVKSIRQEIISLGGEIRFNSLFEGFISQNGSLKSIKVNGKEMPCENLIVCCGHSTRDTFSALKNNGICMEKKPFSVGLRIEHLQSDINRALYGRFADHPALSAADYKMAVHLENGRGVYTFCMCPGGEVINASSGEGIAVNGMSKSARNGKNANSALLVGVTPEDFNDNDVLAGCRFQEKIEKAAAAAANGKVPVDTVGHFVFGEKAKIDRVKPTVLPCCELCDLEGIFPDFVTDSLRRGIELFDKKIKGFAEHDAVLTAPETRSSSPVRIIRGQDGQANVKGVYPAGEGAGYAGGIMSAAVDGIKTAEKILEKLTEKL